MKLVVGLGNIGNEYKDTNHNAGFMVLDALSEKLGFTFKNRGCDSDYAEFRGVNEKFIFAKPRTYMNESGRAVKSLMKKFDVDIQDVFVVNDDIDLEPGYVRIRTSGSAGTHNGLRSIVAETKSQEFNRIRVGVGKQQNQHQDLASFVLAKMFMSDAQKQGLEKATLALFDLTDGATVQDIMAKYNGDSGKNGRH